MRVTLPQVKAIAARVFFERMNDLQVKQLVVVALLLIKIAAKDGNVNLPIAQGIKQTTRRKRLAKAQQLRDALLQDRLQRHTSDHPHPIAGQVCGTRHLLHLPFAGNGHVVALVQRRGEMPALAALGRGTEGQENIGLPVLHQGYFFQHFEMLGAFDMKAQPQLRTDKAQGINAQAAVAVMGLVVQGQRRGAHGNHAQRLGQLLQRGLLLRRDDHGLAQLHPRRLRALGGGVGTGAAQPQGWQPATHKQKNKQPLRIKAFAWALCGAARPAGFFRSQTPVGAGGWPLFLRPPGQSWQ